VGLRAARERALRPLIERSSRELDLDADQARRMRSLLESAWSHGTNNGQEQVRVWVEGQTGAPAPTELDPAPIEAEFEDLMHRSAAALDLALPQAALAWQYLTDAWIAGIYAAQELLLAYLTTDQPWDPPNEEAASADRPEDSPPTKP